MIIKQGEILSGINSVEDLRKLKVEQLPALCEDLRQFIIDSTSLNPGHLGANLGTIELTVALHYVFNTPYDKLVFDVGHQAYTHKILTGRKDLFHTNRMYKGLSGYPRMSESEFDAFGVGHSSTSISAALGMAVASVMKGEKDRHHIALIGDGSMTGGMAFEALNHTGVAKSNLLVVLNDNGIAIDKNVGALKEYLTNITTSPIYNKLKLNIWNIITGKTLRKLINKLLGAIKSAIVRQSNLFESLGFRYFGPVDGHDVVRLVKLFNYIKDIRGPKILHCITVKGKGFTWAEKDQTRFHAPGMFDPDTGINVERPCGNKRTRYQVVFGKTLVKLAGQNPKIVGVTPAMLTGCSMNMMMAKFPERTFDVGIAEQHAVTFSAGMAVQGMIPYCNIYSSFLQRAYDQIIHDVALQKLHVVFCIDRGGLVGEDGATHHGAFDLAYLRCIPGMIVSAPMNEEELRNLLYTAQYVEQPFAIRYPRCTGVMDDWETPFQQIEIGKGRKIMEGQDLAFISIGHVGNVVADAINRLHAENIFPALYDIRFLKPLDESLLHEVFRQHKKIITVEDGTVVGGLGTAVTEFMNQHHYEAEIVKLGVPDRFVEQGTLDQLYAECGYDENSIFETAKKLFKTK
ncbi:MAG TPA: 1-deoxy-D-xylulose-5-phosphate synthase [Bacteroidales bacterium]|nr:1-deoxy-D-xylulose-5-phosphate synthase [Bacteroidales bacterium]HPI29815.1 1-deoxy-D-xylulose-5-phosphate synthase [Bacteroidales bacterium]HQN15559.1 1-deoxy-D-xylulose-5-phosphate synthase [Bacteroidales bacterium]HQP15348.1 1-deoxy-D-xylulose-5-phosphate synthase [Bacteroidales bacterium]